jgi:hypothetical protein
LKFRTDAWYFVRVSPLRREICSRACVWRSSVSRGVFEPWTLSLQLRRQVGLRQLTGAVSV